MKSLLKSLLNIAISLTVSLIFWTLISTISLFLFPLRYFIQRLLNLIYGHGKYTLAIGIDSVFAYNKTPGSSAIIHSVLVIKGNPDLNKIRRMYQDQVFKYTDNKGTLIYKERLKKTFVPNKYGFACWLDNSREFDINRHVKYVEGLAPTNQKGPIKITEDKLLSLIGRLLDDSKFGKGPQWEHLIVPNYVPNLSDLRDEGPYFCSIVRVHHAYADGASFGILMDSVLSDGPIKFAMNPLKKFNSEGSEGQLSLGRLQDLISHLYAYVLGPLSFLITLKSAICDNSGLIMKGYSEKKVLGWTEKIEMKYLKEIRKKSGASIAAILLSAVTGALKQFHQKQRPNQVIPYKINIANMAIMLPYTSRSLQNHFTTFSLPCPLTLTSSSRLLSTDTISRKISSSTEPLFNFFIMRWSGYLPRLVQDFLAFMAGTPVLFSNVPGALEKFSVFGGQVVDAGAWLPLVKTYGVGIATYSYCGKIRVCFSTDEWLMDSTNLKWFVEKVMEELELTGREYGVNGVLGGLKDKDYNRRASYSYPTA